MDGSDGIMMMSINQEKLQVEIENESPKNITPANGNLPQKSINVNDNSNSSSELHQNGEDIIVGREEVVELDVEGSVEEAEENGPTGDLVVPIVYGTIARVFDDVHTQRLLNVKVEEGFSEAHLSQQHHTHSWTVYLRPFNNEDLSAFISKVEFRLHESFTPPVRVCHEMPYEVTESGWGEFFIFIRIYFRDRGLCNGRFLTPEPHFLKLFLSHPPTVENDSAEALLGGTVTAAPRPQLPPPGVPVINEVYNELVIPGPSELVSNQLEFSAANPREDWTPPNVDWNEVHDRQLKELIAARQQVRQEIDELKALFEQKKKQVDMEKRELLKSSVLA